MGGVLYLQLKKQNIKKHKNINKNVMNLSGADVVLGNLNCQGWDACGHDEDCRGVLLPVHLGGDHGAGTGYQAEY